jgi:hypothetical protein
MQRALAPLFVLTVLACSSSSENVEPNLVPEAGFGGAVGDASVDATTAADERASSPTATPDSSDGLVPVHPEASGAEDGSTTPADATKVNCDPRAILCRRMAPSCGVLEVPSVEGTCYGPCVKVDLCACTEAAACPDSSQYTCLLSAQHCTPFLQ